MPVCHGDRSMLKLVVANLVSNAVKFTRNRANAEIEIGCIDRGEDEVEVYVRDNGAGFDMQYAHKLFGVFQRLHRAEEFGRHGNWACDRSADRSSPRRKVRAEGVIGQGARFHFFTEGTTRSGEDRRYHMTTLGRILIVEDDPADTDLTSNRTRGIQPRQ